MDNHTEYEINGYPSFTLLVNSNIFQEILHLILWMVRAGELTTFIKDVIFHRAYTRARPAECLGPGLNKAFIPAGNGDSKPKGRINKTKRKSSIEIEYKCRKVRKTKLKSNKSSTEMNRPTRSCQSNKCKEKEKLDYLYIATVITILNEKRT